jgi:hypothetical protein
MVEAFEDEVQRVMRSGALGRSAAYSRLLQYLHQCSIAGTTPKELDIAVEVFDRSAGFDPSQDSMVRVYVHKLRQKLDTYYDEYGQTSDQRLVIPPGQGASPVLADRCCNSDRSSDWVAPDHYRQSRKRYVRLV